jgi:hypothetical protein
VRSDGQRKWFTFTGMGAEGVASYASARVRLAAQTPCPMSEHEQQMVRELLDAVIVKNQVAGALERVTKPEAKERRTRPQGKA